MQYLTPHPGFSKELILSRREEELAHAIESESGSAKIQKAADRLRDAHLQLLRAKLKAIRPVTDPGPNEEKKINRLKEEVEAWLSMSSDDIISSHKKAEPGH